MPRMWTDILDVRRCDRCGTTIGVLAEHHYDDGESSIAWQKIPHVLKQCTRMLELSREEWPPQGVLF